jgi:hypothetical protein
MGGPDFYSERKKMIRVPERIESAKNRYGESLPLRFVRNVPRTYPDTGESGDAYDAEAYLDY